MIIHFLNSRCYDLTKLFVTAGGHAVGLNLSIRYLFGIHPGDTIFCASDIGWVVGHSYILYAPLLAGATTVLFEGKPIGTPDAGTFWRILDEYKVNALFTAPTALRAIRRDDPENKFLNAVGKRGGLQQLRALFLAGERSEPSIVRMYQDLLQRYCAPGAQVIDNWWSSESGSPISGIALHPVAAVDFSSKNVHKALPIKPGAAGKPMPGFDVRIVNDQGIELGKGEMGNIVLASPLAPTGFTTLFNDDERFYKGYLKRFDGRWIDTGDAGMTDKEGYVHVLSRTDDIINVAAHRFSTGSSTFPMSMGIIILTGETPKAPSNKPSPPTPPSPNAASSASLTAQKATSPSPSSPSPPPHPTPPSPPPTSSKKSNSSSANRSALSPPWAA